MTYQYFIAEKDGYRVVLRGYIHNGEPTWLYYYSNYSNDWLPIHKLYVNVEGLNKITKKEAEVYLVLSELIS